MKYRKATIKDIPALNQIALHSKKHWGYPDAWMASWRSALTITSNHLTSQQILVAEMHSVITGFCVISECTDHYEIEHLWLLPEYMGKGIGKRLLEDTTTLFIENKKPVIVVSDPNAEDFYTKQEFVRIDLKESTPPGRYLPVLQKIPNITDHSL